MELISKEQAIETFKDCAVNGVGIDGIVDALEQLPPIQHEIIRCKDCQYWNKGSCECREHAVNCQDYYVGDIETEAEYFCGYAERRKVTT